MNYLEIAYQVLRMRGFPQAEAHPGVFEAGLPANGRCEISEENLAERQGLPLSSGEYPTPQEIAEALDACLRLGQRLAQGEFSALRCGITGKVCRLCKGIPCLGSVPVE